MLCPNCGSRLNVNNTEDLGLCENIIMQPQ